MGEIKLKMYLGMRYVGCKIDEEVSIYVPENYDIEKDEDNIIEDVFKEWIFENIDVSWQKIN